MVDLVKPVAPMCSSQLDLRAGYISTNFLHLEMLNASVAPGPGGHGLRPEHGDPAAPWSVAGQPAPRPARGSRPDRRARVMN